jgi:hypothetical protein
MPNFAELLQALSVIDNPFDTVEELRQRLRRIPIVRVDNVYDYFKAHRHEPQPHDLALLPPPFPEFWMEFHAPLPNGGDTVHMGAHVQERRGKEWWTDIAFFVGGERRPEARCIAVHCSRFDEQGNELRDDESSYWKSLNYHEELEPEIDFDRSIHGTSVVFVLAIMFMHCKNVTRIEHAPPPKLAKRNIERGKPPMLKYQTLELGSLKRLLRTKGRIESEGLERALHICRGHFAYYPESGPGLFGRGIHGRFWVPMHTRGTEKKGAVISDYKVKPPKEEAS